MTFSTAHEIANRLPAESIVLLPLADWLKLRSDSVKKSPINIDDEITTVRINRVFFKFKD